MLMLHLVIENISYNRGEEYVEWYIKARSGLYKPAFYNIPYFSMGYIILMIC